MNSRQRRSNVKKTLLSGIAALLLATGAAYPCAWPCNDEQRARAGWPGYEQSPHIKCFATLCIAEEVPVKPRPDQLIKPTWNGGPPEPYYKPKELTPTYVEWLRRMKYLPPEEFDHEFKGELTVKRGTQQELRIACPNTFRPGNLALGCALRYLSGAACVIYIVNDSTLQFANWDYEIVLRHERAHCNGWHHD